MSSSLQIRRLYQVFHRNHSLSLLIDQVVLGYRRIPEVLKIGPTVLGGLGLPGLTGLLVRDITVNMEGSVFTTDLSHDPNPGRGLVPGLEEAVSLIIGDLLLPLNLAHIADPQDVVIGSLHCLPFSRLSRIK